MQKGLIDKMFGKKKNAVNEAGEQVKTKKKMSKKVKRRLIISGVAVVLIGYIVGNSVMASEQPITVTTVKVLKGDVEQTINTSGIVESDETKTYFSPLNATVETVNVAVGDVVNAGDILLAFDEEELEEARLEATYQTEAAKNSYLGTTAQNDESQGKYAEAVTNLEILEQQIEMQKFVVEDLEDKIENKTNEVNNRLAEKELRLQKQLLTEQTNLTCATGTDARTEINFRIRNIQSEIDEVLHEKSMVSQNLEIKALEEQLADAKELLAEFEEDKTEMKAQKTSSESRAADKYTEAQLSANANATEITQKRAEQNLELAKGGMTAEFSGIVTAVPAKEGASVVKGTELLVVQSNEEISIVIEVSKYDLEKIQVGQKADITIAGKAYEGELTKINRMAVKNASGNAVIQAEIRVNAPDDNIYLGIEAKVILHTATKTDILLAPYEVVNADVEGDFVYVVENGVVTRKPVVTGISSDMYIEIVEGLSEGDQVISDLSFATEGMEVVAVEQEQQ